ncbi:vertebrate ancient long opsin a [Thalassophryne amazonica]|uniref:vertebrate ancient long opsin a n=1 Tax=Thalassophryne amazonica TaxID=390379 RepID=UPI001471ABA6|nr:vertebrate ancient long opsin a [Thalassophryne amazonica]
MDTLSLSVNAVSHTAAAELSGTDDPFKGPIRGIAPWNFTILAVLMFVVTSLSLSENFLVMFVTFKFKQLRQPLNYIIVNLAIADFLVSLTGGAISFLTNTRGYFFLGKWACVMEGFAVTFFVNKDVYQSLPTASLSQELLAPGGFVQLLTPQSQFLQQVRVFCPLSFVHFLHSLIPWYSQHEQKSSSFGCGPQHHIWSHLELPTQVHPNLQSSPNARSMDVGLLYSSSNTDHSYIITFFTTCFILPLGVIFFCYGKLLQKLRKVSHGRLPTAKKPERQVTRMVVVMIVAFMVGWTPYAVFSILVTAHPTIELDPRLASIPAFFSKTAAVYNPVIYVFMNKQFRKCLIHLFTGMGVIPESDINQTSDRPRITAECQTGEMSAIAAQISVGGATSSKSEDSPVDFGSLAQLPIPENKVCPM